MDLKSLSKIDIDKNLQNLKQNILNSQFGYFIDESDPFSIFKKESKSSTFFIKNAHLAIKDRGYFSTFSISSGLNTIDGYKKIHDEVMETLKDESGVKVFSPIFYFAQNSKIIKDDVNKIIYIATFVLILLYIVILRDLKLLLNALLSLGSSILFALLVSTFLFEEISIFVLVFGISISSVAIDYMFHHYVHGGYEGAFEFNKDVFLGMLTTISAFFILSFVPFALIKQLAIFTVLSLIFSYIQFAFLYQIVGFRYKNSSFLGIKTIQKIPVSYILLFSVIMFFVTTYNFRFDTNIKNLDVQNSELKATEEFFTSFNGDMHSYLIRADSLDELIDSSKVLKQKLPLSYAPLATLLSAKEFEQKQNLLKSLEIEKLNKAIELKSKEFGFSSGYFTKAYKVLEDKPTYLLDSLQHLGIDVLEFDGGYISYVGVSKDDVYLLDSFDFIKSVSAKSIFEDELGGIKNELVYYGAISIGFIILMVLFSYRKNLPIYLAFLFFPFVMILSLSLFMELNLLHIFILFIILSISIDYGIYISSAKKDNNTNRAILYSIFTTFAGFGVLIFSNIEALFSIGISATIGVVSILFLLIFLKRPHGATSSI